MLVSTSTALILTAVSVSAIDLTMCETAEDEKYASATFAADYRGT